LLNDKNNFVYTRMTDLCLSVLLAEVAQSSIDKGSIFWC